MEEKEESTIAQKSSGWIKQKRSGLKQRLTMEGMLGGARQSLQQFSEHKKDTQLQFEKTIATHLWKNACAVVFLTEIRAGLIPFGAKVSAGIMVVRIEGTDKWSAPIALKGGGMSTGIQIGASKVDHIIVLPSSEHIRMFLDGKGQFKLSGNVEAVVANYGRDAEVGVGINTNGDMGHVVTYSINCKGVYVGMTMRGAVLTARSNTMDAFYGTHVEVEDIVSGKVVAPMNCEDYNIIIELLAHLEKGKEMMSQFK